MITYIYIYSRCVIFVANRVGGSVVIGEKIFCRKWSIPLEIDGDDAGALNRAGKKRNETGKDWL